MSRWSPAAGQPPTEREPWCDPSVVLGSSGPTRVSREDDADPTYEPPPIIGFLASPRAKAIAAEVAAATDARARELLGEQEPLRWEGDDS